MRILLLTQWFDPEPHYKGLVFAQALVNRGHDVEVLTGFPNYPGGRVYQGYRIRFFQREVMDGIVVLRTPLYPSHDRSALRRIANYVSFAVTACAALFTRRRYDAVYVYTPPPTVAGAAWLYGKLTRTPYLCDVQDLWPDTLAATGMLSSPWVLRLVGWFVDLWLRGAGRIVVLSNGFRERLVARGHDPNRVVVIPNWSAESPAPAASQSPPPLDLPADQFNVIFAGNIGTAQGLDVVIEAASEFQRRDVHVQFTIVGDGVDADRLRDRALRGGLSNVFFAGRRPPWSMAEIFNRADALLVHLRDDALFRITIPSKTQAYLRAGRPILMGVKGDAADLICDAGAGRCFIPDSASGLVDAIEELREMSGDERAALGRSGRAFYDEHLSIERGVEAFDRELRAIVAER